MVAVPVRLPVFNFNPRSPCGERPVLCASLISPWTISIHALLAESDSLLTSVAGLPEVFQSTLSLRRATLFWDTQSKSDQFQSTLSLRRATQLRCFGRNRPGISIHALLAESDMVVQRRVFPEPDFNPRSPCGERRNEPVYLSLSPISIHALLAESDRGRFLKGERVARFQSTLSLRRATSSSHSGLCSAEFQSTLSLRRATFAI